MEQQFYQVLPIASLVTDDSGFVATGFIQPRVILSSRKQSSLKIASCEDWTHDLQIMRLTRSTALTRRTIWIVKIFFIILQAYSRNSEKFKSVWWSSSSIKFYLLLP